MTTKGLPIPEDRQQRHPSVFATQLQLPTRLPNVTINSPLLTLSTQNKPKSLFPSSPAIPGYGGDQGNVGAGGPKGNP